MDTGMIVFLAVVVFIIANSIRILREYERRAKVIHADGEFQASSKLKDAANVMAAQPVAVQLRYLQTLTEIATEKNSTVVFPLPMDLLAYFMKSKVKGS